MCLSTQMFGIHLRMFILQELEALGVVDGSPHKHPSKWLPGKRRMERSAYVQGCLSLHEKTMRHSHGLSPMLTPTTPTEGMVVHLLPICT